VTLITVVPSPGLVQATNKAIGLKSNNFIKRLTITFTLSIELL